MSEHPDRRPRVPRGPPVFTDRAGRTWTPAASAELGRAVYAASGLDVAAAVRTGEGVTRVLTADLGDQAAAVWAACRAEAEARGAGEAGFLAGLDATATAAGTAAVLLAFAGLLDPPSLVRDVRDAIVDVALAVGQKRANAARRALAELLDA